MNNKDWEKCWRFTNTIVLLFKPLEFLVRRNIRRGMERLLSNFKLDKPNILELGAGTGRDSEWLIKRLNGKSTLVDNCDYIISKSKKYFSKRRFDVKHFKSNIEDIEFKNEYDLVFSVGLVEHFYNRELYSIFKKHSDSTKKGGYVMIFVPNDGRVYRFYRRLLAALGLWMWDERPFNIDDLKNLGKSANSKLLRTTKVIGGMWIGAVYQKL